MNLSSLIERIKSKSKHRHSNRWTESEIVMLLLLTDKSQSIEEGIHGAVN